MYEEHVGTLAHSTVGNLAGADIEKRIRLSTKEIGRIGRGERGHRTSGGIVGQSAPRLRDADCSDHYVSIFAVITTIK